MTLVLEIISLEEFMEMTPSGMGPDVGDQAPAVPSTVLHGS